MKPFSKRKSTPRRSPEPGPAHGMGLSRNTRSKRAMAGFVRDESGAVAIITGLTIPVLLGFAGLAVEYSQILGVRAEAQRTADFASHAAAVAYNRSSDLTEMTNAAQAVARLNGFRDDEIDVRLDPSVSAASGAAVRATITTPKPLYLPRLVGGDTSVDVVASAVAGAQGGDSACIQALDPKGSGITMSGGTTLRADACGVASNAEVAAPCGTQIIAPSLSYNAGTDPRQNNCSNDPIQGPDGEATKVSRKPTTDPLAGMAALMTATTQLADTASLSGPGGTTAPNIEFAYDQSNTKTQAQAIGCTASFASSGNTWTFSCPGKSTVNIGNITMGGGVTLLFNPGAAKSTVYNISGSIRNTGMRMTFAGGTYNVSDGIFIGGGSVTKFGTGSGTGFRFGPNAGGEAIRLEGSAQLFMEDAKVDVFEVEGRISTLGGSCLEVPAADVHEINGAINAKGAVTFGAGLYAIDGYMHLGADGGGNVWCAGETRSVKAIETTFAIAGDGIIPGGSECGGQAFCVSAGYSNIRIEAPQSGPFKDLAVIGPLDAGNNAGAKFTAGASGAEISGAFYFPNGPILFDGGASASGGGGCLQVIGSEVAMSGGTSLASSCDLPQAGGGGGRVVLLR